jgi:hypothetical protein
MKYSIFPLIKGFRSTSYIHAFILNALCASIIAAISIEIRFYLDDLNIDLFNTTGKNLNRIEKTFLVFLFAFIIIIIVYVLMYAIFGFGGGMLSPP